MLQYHVDVKNTHAHTFAVAIEIPISAAGEVTLRLPAWLPGSYMIRDFARNINDFSAVQAGAVLQHRMLDKQTWVIEHAKAGSIRVEYEVYAFDLSVRTAYLDQQFGFFNFSSMCLAVDGYVDEPCLVHLSTLTGWQLATGMPRTIGHRFAAGTFTAQSYDELIDYPVLMGDLNIHEFLAGGVKHSLVFAGREFADADRICSDLADICEYQIEMFGQQPPFHEYLFLTMVVGNGFGGLEHRNSTALLCSRKDLITANQTKIDANYRTFLSLCSHEYFHSWNIKTLKPRSFIPYKLDQESYTEQLWFYEGVTSYYDDYVLNQAGLIDAQTYLNLVGDTLARVHRGQGHERQTITESSFLAWTKFYKQDENSPNSIVSYYAKGALIALCIDLQLRLESQHQVTLAKVMNEFWHAYGATSIGTEASTFVGFVQQHYDISLHSFLQQALYSTQTLPVQELLSEFGVTLTRETSQNDNIIGGTAATNPLPVSLGAKYKATEQGLELQVVYNDEAAQAAGLSARDRIIAIDNFQVTQSTIDEVLARYQPGDAVAVHAFRRDELLTLAMTFQAPPKANYLLKVTAPELLHDWLR